MPSYQHLADDGRVWCQERGRRRDVDIDVCLACPSLEGFRDWRNGVLMVTCRAEIAERLLRDLFEIRRPGT